MVKRDGCWHATLPMIKISQNAELSVFSLIVAVVARRAFLGIRLASCEPLLVRSHLKITNITFARCQVRAHHTSYSARKPATTRLYCADCLRCPDGLPKKGRRYTHRGSHMVIIGDDCAFLLQPISRSNHYCLGRSTTRSPRKPQLLLASA